MTFYIPEDFAMTEAEKTIPLIKKRLEEKHQLMQKMQECFGEVLDKDDRIKRMVIMYRANSQKG